MWGQTEITSLSQITAKDGNYIITGDISGGAPGVATFNGTLEAAIDPETHMPYRITGLSAPLFTTLTGTVKNLVLENVSISGNTGDTGAIACKADSTARIYNVGILSGSVGGTGYTGGLIGFLDGTARVINCYSYANITGGSEKGGIVGNNNKTSKQGAITTMVMNCMFYGDIADGNTIAPIYGGTEITNASGGLPNYNFYRYRSRYSITKKITKYNCALAMEEKFINRFERYRLLLNSNKKLAAWYITGNVNDTAIIAKWVLETADRTISNPKPYPILKAQGKYPSIINYDAEHAPDSAAVGRFKGGRVGTLDVTISGIGDNASSLAKFTMNRTSVDTTLVMTDKDEDRFNFNYKKVQLPYFNEMGEGNCTKNRVVTGWEITGFKGRTSDTFDTGDKWGAYNFADRNCTSKDLYSKTKRVFSQGAYYDVPNGVTGITIKPHWATAAYVADNRYDVAYSDGYGADGVENMGEQTSNGGNKIINGDSQKVYTSVGNARASMEVNGKFADGATVYDYAVVLVGNVHQDGNPTTANTPYTIMSIDENKDNEPDYTYIFAHKSRQNISPIRFDFLNIMGIAEAQLPKNNNAKMTFRNVSIFKSLGWLEITNTCVVNFSQLEYDDNVSGKANAPVILLGGTYEQIVSTNGAINNTIQYVHVGSNAWFAKFGPGTHSDGRNFTNHVPVSVTGGDYDEFYLTGTYQPNLNNTLKVDSAECYVSGGRFGEMAGASLEPLKGSVRWDINYADITNFYGGGVNANKPVEGNIRTDIANSHVERFCGGPKFGDMSSGKTVTTNATNCTFGTFFGAGFGGNSYNRVKYRDVADAAPADYQNYYSDGTSANDGKDRGKYFDGGTTNASYDSGKDYGKKGKGVATDFDYEYFVWSTGQTGARFYVKFITFSLAKTNDVTSKLTKCTVNNNFYGGGSLGKVLGTATSILDDCTINGNVFGGGYSATIPKIEVRNTPAFKSGKEPNKNINIGMFEEGEIADSVIYEWKHVDNMPENGKIGMESTSAGNFVYTDEDLTSLGQVGTVNLTIKGNTNVAGKIEDGINTGGNVYGGGEESNVSGDTRVNISGGTIAQNVYGGGKGVADEFACTKAMIGINDAGADNPDPAATKDKGTIVNISDGTVNGNVYGGGEVGRVEWNTQVTIGEENGTGEPVVEGYVFGAGKGLKTHGYAALVRGNPTVIIQGNAKIKKSVYGGGEIASVARYKVATTAEEAAEHGVGIDMPYALANNYSGNCKVIVGGYAIIGPDEPMKMYHPEIADGSDKPDDAGHVFGAGKGVLPEVYTYEDNEHRPKRMLLYNAESLPDEGYWEYADAAHKNIWEYFKDEDSYFAFIKTLALSSKTEVTIKDNAFVKGSVYGGSENGLVQFDTDVKIQGGQIGCGKNATAPYGDDVWANEDTPSDDLECASWSYEAPYAPYDPNANATGDLDKYSSGKSTEGGRRIATDGHTYYGNVFGGGSGSVPYFDTEKGVSRYVSSAGMVKGNTKVTISGGHILTNVYGGCEATNVLGSATITMTGGSVGVPRTLKQIVAHPVTCYIFGAGKGDQRIFFNKETNVDRTFVNIEGGRVYGSVFGGGEDGHVFQNTTVNIGKDNTDGPTIGTLGTSYVDGNVFGGGRGFGGDALTAGNIGGSVELNIKSGKILGSVYGGGRLASVGYGLYLEGETITEGGQTIKPYGILRPNDKYDGSYPNPSKQEASAYYDKGRGNITINISGGTIGNDNEYIYNPTAEQKAAIPNTTFDYQNHLQYTKGGNVFTGGMGRLYALDNATLLPIWSKLGKCKQTVLNMTGGTVKSSIYGGGEIGGVALDATVNINGGTVGTKVVDPEDATKYYYFGSVFGGGKGSTANVEGISEAGTTGGDVQVNLNKGVAENAKGAVVSQVFGCNDMNGSPKGTVTVHVYATQNADKDKISAKYDKGTEKFDVMAVYGGGNLAAYEPTDLTTGKAQVIIDGCELTSIRQVYGGGNAASVPATDVLVNGTYEIEEVFGGGNGLDALPNGRPNPGANVGYKNYTIYEEEKAKDDPNYDTKEERTAEGSSIVYGTGAANVNIKGGTIHRVFGGSNTKGNVRITAVTMLEEAGGCAFCVDEAYGGGKSAPMDAEAKLLMACIPGLKEAYGGAKNAEIDGDVTLTITNGTFERIFGGNDEAGYIKGTITVNIEETGCKPIIIGELYGGGNQAPYTAPEGKQGPTLNVKSFTSIGDIFGGGLGSTAKVTGDTYVNINVSEGRWRDGTYQYATDPSVGVNDKITELNGKGYHAPEFTSGIGSIHTVFGGGNAAPVTGNTNVYVGTSEYDEIVSVAAGSDVTGYYTRSGEGTEASPYTYTEATGTAVEGTTYYKKVKGADIRGNIYGGGLGSTAEVTGNTNVVIGKKKE